MTVAANRQIRKHSKIDGLPPEIREAAEQMLLAGATYREVADYLVSEGVGISLASVCRHAQALNANVQMIKIAQENFRRIQEQLDKYPDMDTSDAILKLASHKLMMAIGEMDDNKLSDVDPDKLIKESSALIRAASAKKRADADVRTNREEALEELKGVLFAEMQREQPELYKQVAEYINRHKAE